MAALIELENVHKTYRLGDKVKVQVIRVNMEVRQLDLGLVEILERVREGAIGQRRRRWMHAGTAGHQDGAVPAGSIRLRKLCDHPAPRQVGSEDGGGNRIGNALLGALDHIGWNLLVAQRCSVLCQDLRFFRHVTPRCHSGLPLAQPVLGRRVAPIRVLAAPE